MKQSKQVNVDQTPGNQPIVCRGVTPKLPIPKCVDSVDTRIVDVLITKYSNMNSI